MRGDADRGLARGFGGGRGLGFGFFTATTGPALLERVGGRRLGDRGACPAVQGPRGMRASGREAKRSACGQAAAKARRTRLAISTTRAAILRSFMRKVANSALARSRAAGMASRTVSISQ